jgi:hypothetical protein
MLQRKQLAIYFLTISSALLIAIWPFPGTMALRNIILVVGAASSLFWMRGYFRHFMKMEFYPVWMIVLFFVWVIFHYYVFGMSPEEQLYELKGIWLRTFLSTLIGVGLGLGLAVVDDFRLSRNVELIIIAGFFGVPFMFLIRYLYEIYITGSIWHENFFMYPYLSKVPIAIFGGMMLPLVLIRVLRNTSSEEHWGANGIAAAGLFLFLFAAFFSSAKNAFLIFSLVAFLFLWGMPWRYFFRSGLRPSLWMGVISGGVIALVFAVFIKHIESYDAWRNPLADIRVAVDIDNNQRWKVGLDAPLPQNEYGVPVSITLYERTAWIVAGVRLIRENPMGYGLLSHSFGPLAQAKWPDFKTPNASGKTKGATHSGWVDFTLGLGIPGLLLVVIPLLVSVARSFCYSSYWSHYVRWCGVVIAVAYLTSEAAADHFIELLFFMLAWCSTYMSFMRIRKEIRS